MSAVSAAVLLLFADPLSPVLGASAEHIRAAGGPLVPFALLAAWVATRVPPPSLGVWTVIALNVTWVADSFFLLASGWVPFTTAGSAFAAAQALLVALAAFLEFAALRRQPRFDLSKA